MYSYYLLYIVCKLWDWSLECWSWQDVGQQPRRASWSCGQRLMADATLVLSTDSVKNEQQMQQDCEPETDDKVKIQQHAEGTCKPCVFFASTAGCHRPKCPYCHLSHVHKSTPRPRKSNREIFKQAVDKVFQQEQAGVFCAVLSLDRCLKLIHSKEWFFSSVDPFLESLNPFDIWSSYSPN